jgi:monofunctional biosynthetic peptidoglycan transglycosylase
MWSKKRILEVYVNVVEFGDGVYGAQAAAKSFYNKSAQALNQTEAANLAAVLPNPKVYNAQQPGPYVKRRSKAIVRQMRALGGTAYLNACCQR